MDGWMLGMEPGLASLLLWTMWHLLDMQPAQSWSKFAWNIPWDNTGHCKESASPCIKSYSWLILGKLNQNSLINRSATWMLLFNRLYRVSTDRQSSSSVSATQLKILFLQNIVLDINVYDTYNYLNILLLNRKYPSNSGPGFCEKEIILETFCDPRFTDIQFL